MRIADVIGMAALVVVILVTLIVTGNLSNVSDNIAGDLNSSDYNSTAASLFSNTYTGLELGSIAIIVAAAVGILGLVIGALGAAGRGGGVAV